MKIIILATLLAGCASQPCQPQAPSRPPPSQARKHELPPLPLPLMSSGLEEPEPEEETPLRWEDGE